MYLWQSTFLHKWRIFMDSNSLCIPWSKFIHTVNSYSSLVSLQKYLFLKAMRKKKEKKPWKYFKKSFTYTHNSSPPPPPPCTHTYHEKKIHQGWKSWHYARAQKHCITNPELGSSWKSWGQIEGPQKNKKKEFWISVPIRSQFWALLTEIMSYQKRQQFQRRMLFDQQQQQQQSRSFQSEQFSNQDFGA